MCGCFAYTYVCVACTCPEPTEAEEGVWSPGTRVTEGCEPSCGCWKLDLGSLGRAASAFNLSPLSNPNIYYFKKITLYGGGVRVPRSRCEGWKTTRRAGFLFPPSRVPGITFFRCGAMPSPAHLLLVGKCSGFDPFLGSKYFAHG